MSYPALPNVGNSEEGSGTLRIEPAGPSSSTRQSEEDGTPDARPPHKPHPSNISKWTTLEHTSDLQDGKPTVMTSETERILSWPAFAYYEILDVKEDAPTQAIRFAYRQKIPLVHSDRNNDPDATDAFQRLKNAYDILNDTKRRRKYNKERVQHKKNGLLVQRQFAAAFEQGAYTLGDSEDEGDPGGDDQKPLTERQQAIYDQMGKTLKKYLRAGEISDLEELRKLDEQMKAENVREGVWTTMNLLPLELIQKTGTRRMELLKKIYNLPPEDPGVKGAMDELRHVKNRFDQQMGDLGYPEGWTFEIPPTTATPGTTTATGQQPYAAHVSDPTRMSVDTEPPGRGSASSGNLRHSSGGASTGPDRMCIDPEAPSQANAGQGVVSPSGNGPSGQAPTFAPPVGQIVPAWQQGQTTRGEWILGYRLIERTAQEKGTGRWVQIEPVACDFVIEKQGQNPIQVVDAARVGLNAVESYKKWPHRHNIVNIGRNFDRSHKDSFGEIRGFARKEQRLSGNLPLGVVLIEYQNNPVVITRDALRKVFPRADTMINEFLLSIGEQPEESKSVRRAMRILKDQHELQLDFINERYGRQKSKANADGAEVRELLGLVNGVANGSRQNGFQRPLVYETPRGRGPKEPLLLGDSLGDELVTEMERMTLEYRRRRQHEV